MTKALRCANCAVRSIMRKKTSTGAAEPTCLTMEEKCGGAAENVGKTSLGASSQSTSSKTKMRKMTSTTKRKTRPNI